MASIVLNGQPISTNNCYFHLRAGVRIMTPKARKLKEDYMWQVKSQWRRKPLSSELEIGIKIYYGNKRSFDWDNFHKLSIDSLTGIVWTDDSQIQKATVEKFYDKNNPRIEIDIKEYEQKRTD